MQISQPQFQMQSQMQSQPQFQMTQPQMQISQPQFQMQSQMQSQSQLQQSQPHMQLSQPQMQVTQSYQPVQLEIQLASPSALTGPHPVFRKKGRAPSIPQTPTTPQVPGHASSFNIENQDASHLQRAQQQQPDHPVENPPGFGLVPLQPTNGWNIIIVI